MKAIEAAQAGGPEVMALVDVPTPAPGPGEALVRIEATGVNYIDIYYRTGLYPSAPPIRLGLEGAGVVEAVAGEAPVAVGDRVAWASVPGSYATHVLAPIDKLVKVPDGVEPRLAAASMLQGMTADYLTKATYPLKPGDTCLIHAAAGGVGLLLCQMAKSAGARVIATVGSEEKAPLVREAGADETIFYRAQDFADEVRRLTEGRGVDVVYDSVGKETFAKSLASLRRRGMMVTFGNSSGPVPAFEPALLTANGSLFLTRPSLFDYTATREEFVARASAVLTAIATSKLKVKIHATLGLAQAAQAHRLLASRATTGKLLLSSSEQG